jgi:SAM-dependent methyltransferase
LVIDHDNLEEFRDPVAYDLECDSYDEDQPFIEQWVQRLGNPLLDLGCGTGRMALRLTAQGYQVTGVDVVPEMIAHARQKAAERGLTVEWVVADGRTFQLQTQFSCIFMLMNVFQFFLTRQDQEALLARVREHLRLDGFFIFGVRNPYSPNLLEINRLEPHKYSSMTPDGRQLVITEQQQYDPMNQLQHFTCHYQWIDSEREGRLVRTVLRYLYPQEMEALLYYNGFKIVECYGNWQQDPLTPTSSRMIYVCQKRN